ncbi:MAG: hypothetical protein IKZ12_06545 [Alistipes sp.]|nr:hypothetical protein [Alistipes sp.]
MSEEMIEKIEEVENIEQMAEQIDDGLLLARKRLIERTKRVNGELVLERDGEVVHIKAEELE